MHTRSKNRSRCYVAASMTIPLFVLALIAMVVSGCQPSAEQEEVKSPAPPVVVPEITPDHPAFKETIYGRKIIGRFVGKCIEVSSGDSITLTATGNQIIRVRLESIASPKKGQPYFEQATEQIRSLIIGKQVEVAMTRKSGVNSTGWVITNDLNLSVELIQTGLAWQLPQDKDEALAKMVAEAKANRTGLWSQEAPIPPWD